MLETKDLKIPEGIVLSRENVEKAGNVTYVPLYMTFCLDELTEKESDAEGFFFAPVAV